MRRTKAYLEEQLDKSTASELRLAQELAVTKDKLTQMTSKASDYQRIMWDMIEIMKNSSKEGRFPR